MFAKKPEQIRSRLVRARVVRRRSHESAEIQLLHFARRRRANKHSACGGALRCPGVFRSARRKIEERAAVSRPRTQRYLERGFGLGPNI